MIKYLKRGALLSSKRLGIFSAVRTSRWRRRRLTILCYHGVSLADEHEWNPLYYMDPASFEGRLRLLRDGGYNVMPLASALEGLRGGTLPPGSVALTFDDGMYDFYARAFPLLEKYGFPATVYLTTYYSDYNRPVFDVFCSYLLWRGRDSKADLGRFMPGLDGVNLRSEEARSDVRAILGTFVARERFTAADKDALCERLARHLGIDYDDLVERRLLHVLSNAEVRELAAKGVDFQLHTHRHRVPVEREAFLREIRDNRRRIHDLAGANPVHFCYPSGVHRPEFFPWLGEAGVTSATTCEGGLATSRTPSLLLPRIVDGMQLAPIEVEGWLSGVSSFLPRRTVPAPIVGPYAPGTPGLGPAPTILGS